MIVFRFKDSNSFDESKQSVHSSKSHPPAGSTRSEAITLRKFIIRKNEYK